MGEPKTKTVAFILTNQTDDPRILTLTPGMTVAQAMAEAGIKSDYAVQHPDTNRNLEGSEDLFAICDDGEKLRVIPTFTAGAWWNPLSWRRPAKQSEPVPLPPVVATSPTDERWLRRNGWRREGNAWCGVFRVAGHPPMRARIDLRGAVPRACFEKPPAAIERHGCVHRLHAAPDWFTVHEHGALPGRTLRGFVTSVETWMQKVLHPAPRPAVASASRASPQVMPIVRGPRQPTHNGGDW